MGRKVVADTYCVSGPGSMGGDLIMLARRKIYRTFQRLVSVSAEDSILDVGVSADRECAYSNFFERMYPHPEKITAFSDQDASWMEEAWPGVRFVRGDACDLPFQDGSFDVVFSSAVLEHVGSRQRQCRFLRECMRVARKYVFLTTPDRAFPLEMHSGLPFVHWLPMWLFRRILRGVGQSELARESNLNLLSAADIRRLCKDADIAGGRLVRFRFMGIPSNLILVIEKRT